MCTEECTSKRWPLLVSCKQLAVLIQYLARVILLHDEPFKYNCVQFTTEQLFGLKAVFLTTPNFYQFQQINIVSVLLFRISRSCAQIPKGTFEVESLQL